ncbi:SCAN domain-containing protein 3 [Eumeta japonica]|uniref:SCAN domain-containing protein 3 n=1 Tax=Eumeta variegata TaxID=151549 RepID=A0A4C1ZLB4_EUMVA|nr:SCAN domain-containing protein 3 [Eumeta japonica]
MSRAVGTHTCRPAALGEAIKGARPVARLVVCLHSIADKVEHLFLDMAEVSSGTAAGLYDSLKHMLLQKNIPLENMIGFSSDTTNVMVGEHFSVFARLKNDFPHIALVHWFLTWGRRRGRVSGGAGGVEHGFVVTSGGGWTGDDARRRLFCLPKLRKNTHFICSAAHCRNRIFDLFKFKDDDVKEEYLFCKSLPTTTRGEDVFQTLKEFIEENGLDWLKLVGICTDGTPSMMGIRSGFQALVKQAAPQVFGYHCLIHRYALAVKTLPPDLLNTLSDIVKTVNHIRGNATNSTLFKVLCDEVGATFNALLYHTEDKIASFLRKLELYQRRVQAGDVSMFTQLNSLQQYFPNMDSRESYSWISRPFSTCVDIFKDEDVLAKVEFLGLRENNSLKVDFQIDKLGTFGRKAAAEYLIIADRALKMLIPFATTYRCETGFSTLVT